MSKYGQFPATDGLVTHGISMYKYNYIRGVILLERSYNLLASYFLLLTESVAMVISVARRVSSAVIYFINTAT